MTSEQPDTLALPLPSPDLDVDTLREAVESCTPLAHHLARKMQALNPAVPLREFNAAALTALKLAALKFDPARHAKLSTYAWRVIWHELILLARNESARGMHVPTDHDPYYAPRPQAITAGWHHPRAAYTQAVADLGEDFWRSVSRTLCPRERQVVIGVFREGKTLKSLGPELGISKQRASQLLEAAMEKLRRRGDLKELAGAA